MECFRIGEDRDNEKKSNPQTLEIHFSIGNLYNKVVDTLLTIDAISLFVLLSTFKCFSNDMKFRALKVGSDKIMSRR